MHFFSALLCFCFLSSSTLALDDFSIKPVFIVLANYVLFEYPVIKPAVPDSRILLTLYKEDILVDNHYLRQNEYLLVMKDDFDGFEMACLYFMNDVVLGSVYMILNQQSTLTVCEDIEFFFYTDFVNNTLGVQALKSEDCYGRTKSIDFAWYDSSNRLISAGSDYISLMNRPFRMNTHLVPTITTLTAKALEDNQCRAGYLKQPIKKAFSQLGDDHWTVFERESEFAELQGIIDLLFVFDDYICFFDTKHVELPQDDKPLLMNPVYHLNYFGVDLFEHHYYTNKSFSTVYKKEPDLLPTVERAKTYLDEKIHTRLAFEFFTRKYVEKTVFSVDIAPYLVNPLGFAIKTLYLLESIPYPAENGFLLQIEGPLVQLPVVEIFLPQHFEVSVEVEFKEVYRDNLLGYVFHIHTELENLILFSGHLNKKLQDAELVLLDREISSLSLNIIIAGGEDTGITHRVEWQVPAFIPHITRLKFAQEKLDNYILTEIKVETNLEACEGVFVGSEMSRTPQSDENIFTFFVSNEFGIFNVRCFNSRSSMEANELFFVENHKPYLTGIDTFAGTQVLECPRRMMAYSGDFFVRRQIPAFMDNKKMVIWQLNNNNNTNTKSYIASNSLYVRIKDTGKYVLEHIAKDNHFFSGEYELSEPHFTEHDFVYEVKNYPSCRESTDGLALINIPFFLDPYTIESVTLLECDFYYINNCNNIRVTIDKFIELANLPYLRSLKIQIVFGGYCRMFKVVSLQERPQDSYVIESLHYSPRDKKIIVSPASLQRYSIDYTDPFVISVTSYSPTGPTGCVDKKEYRVSEYEYYYKEPTVVIVDSKSQGVFCGGDAFLTAKLDYSDKDPASLTWYKDGVEIKASRTYKTIEGLFSVISDIDVGVYRIVYAGEYRSWDERRIEKGIPQLQYTIHNNNRTISFDRKITADMISPADRAFLMDTDGRGSHLMVDIPAGHTVNVRIPYPEKYGKSGYCPNPVKIGVPQTINKNADLYALIPAYFTAYEAPDALLSVENQNQVAGSVKEVVLYSRKGREVVIAPYDFHRFLRAEDNASLSFVVHDFFDATFSIAFPAARAIRNKEEEEEQTHPTKMLVRNKDSPVPCKEEDGNMLVRTEDSSEEYVVYIAGLTILDFMYYQLLVSFGEKKNKGCLIEPNFANRYWPFVCSFQMENTLASYDLTLELIDTRVQARKTTSSTITVSTLTMLPLQIQCQVLLFPSSIYSVDGALRVNLIGGQAPYIFLWTDLAEAVIQNGILTAYTRYGLGIGQYEVTVIDSYYNTTGLDTCSFQLYANMDLTPRISVATTELTQGCGLSTRSRISFSVFPASLSVDAAGVWEIDLEFAITSCADPRMRNPDSLFIYKGTWGLAVCVQGNTTLLTTPNSHLTVVNYTAPLEVMNVTIGQTCISAMNVSSTKYPVKFNLDGQTFVEPLNISLAGEFLDALVTITQPLTTEVAIITNLIAGNYTIFISDARDCPTFFDVSLINTGFAQCGNCNVSDYTCYDACGVAFGNNTCLYDCVIDNQVSDLTYVIFEIENCVNNYRPVLALSNAPAVTFDLTFVNTTNVSMTGFVFSANPATINFAACDTTNPFALFSDFYIETGYVILFLPASLDCPSYTLTINNMSMSNTFFEIVSEQDFFVALNQTQIPALVDSGSGSLNFTGSGLIGSHIDSLYFINKPQTTNVSLMCYYFITFPLLIDRIGVNGQPPIERQFAIDNICFATGTSVNTSLRQEIIVNAVYSIPIMAVLWPFFTFLLMSTLQIFMDEEETHGKKTIEKK